MAGGVVNTNKWRPAPQNQLLFNKFKNIILLLSTLCCSELIIWSIIILFQSLQVYWCFMSQPAVVCSNVQVPIDERSYIWSNHGGLILREWLDLSQHSGQQTWVTWHSDREVPVCRGKFRKIQERKLWGTLTQEGSGKVSWQEKHTAYG